MPRRRPDAEILLTRYITAQLGNPFMWGLHDCATFALGCIDAMIDTPLDLPEFTYRTEEGAIEFHERHPFIEGLKERGAVVVPDANYRAIGDVFVMVERGRSCCHVLLGDLCAVNAPGHGVMYHKARRLPFAEGVILRVG